MNPIGVGFLDLNAEGLFHLERMRLRPDFRCVAGWNPDQRLPTAHGFLEHVAKSPQALIDDPRISMFWIGPRVDPSLIGLALAEGKHVLLGLPVNTPPDVWKSWAAPRASGSKANLFVAALHRWDGTFQTVQQLVRAGDLGQLLDVRRISRQYVPVELGLKTTASGSVVDPNLDPTRVQQIKWFEMLDELLQLVPDPVVSVLAQQTGSGCMVNVEFATGCRAWLELNRRSLAPLETGWVLDGTAAGFADGKRFRPGPDYELIDVPVEELPTDQAAFYNSVVTTIQEGDWKKSPVSSDSIQRVLELIELIRKSMRAGRTVPV